SGRFLTFMSSARLTTYNNKIRGGGGCLSGAGESCGEVYEYDAASNTLSCASCNPTAQRPIGKSNLSLLRGEPLVPPLPQPHNLAGGGRVFFETHDALSPRDTNRRTDVYEWEPNGVGSCDRSAGCVSLISSGTDPGDSFFVDSTPS